MLVTQLRCFRIETVAGSDSRTWVADIHILVQIVHCYRACAVLEVVIFALIVKQ